MERLPSMYAGNAVIVKCRICVIIFGDAGLNAASFILGVTTFVLCGYIEEGQYTYHGHAG